MKLLPISKVVYPACLAKQTNGGLHPSILVECGLGNFKLCKPAARSMKALIHAASLDGFNVYTTGTYRSYDAQVALFIARHSNTKVKGATVKLWNKKLWWLKAGMANAAKPGTSNHGLGLASDFALKDSKNKTISVTHEFVNWMCINALTFGYSAEIQSENWHWRYVAGDAIPKAVLEFENSLL